MDPFQTNSYQIDRTKYNQDYSDFIYGVPDHTLEYHINKIENTYEGKTPKQKNENKDTNKDTNEVMNKVMNKDTNKDISKDTNKDTDEDTNEDTNEVMNEDTNKDTFSLDRVIQYINSEAKEKNNIKLWRDGINPFTNRKLKLWGGVWIKLMEINNWYNYVEPVNINEKDKYDPKFWSFYTKFENKN